jgi:hypothetical protein
MSEVVVEDAVIMREVSPLRDAVRKLGADVRERRSRIGRAIATQLPTPSDAADAGFVEGVAYLAGLMTELFDDENDRKEFLKDCGFDGEGAL